MDFLSQLKHDRDVGNISDSIYEIFYNLHQSYVTALTRAKVDYSKHVLVFDTYLKLVKKQIATPYQFEPFHKKITTPFNYDEFGFELFRPMVDEENSTLRHPENVEKMSRQLNAKENVILFANHQTEVDPKIIYLILEKKFADLGSNMIFVAGDRVITDPIAVPVSLGCNLLCIYSKRHINNPPEKKEEKLIYNQKTMKRMKQLLAEGGKAIYVAPSGGRDRRNDKGVITLSPFDPQSVEMFRLMAKQARSITHFYPLALKTYDILPPPNTVMSDLGEARLTSRVPIHFSFGDEIDTEHFPGDTLKDRHARRAALSMYVFNLVKTLYTELP